MSVLKVIPSIFLNHTIETVMGELVFETRDEDSMLKRFLRKLLIKSVSGLVILLLFYPFETIMVYQI